MKLISIGLLTACVLAGCGGREKAQAQNSATGTQLSAKTTNKNQSQINAGGSWGLNSAPADTLGVITNNNGVWDDVDQYINSRFTNPDKASAMRQLAIAIQNALLQNDTKENAQEASRVWFRALECLHQKLGEAWYYESKRFTAEVLNSEARSRAYAILNSNSGGFYAQEKGAVCDN